MPFSSPTLLTDFSQISIFKKILRIKSNIKVVDINEEDKQEEPPVVGETPIIEEAKPEEILNKVVEEAPTNEEVQEDKPKPKAKPKPSDRVDCNTCGKNYHTKIIDTDTKNYVQQNLNQ